MDRWFASGCGKPVKPCKRLASVWINVEPVILGLRSAFKLRWRSKLCQAQVEHWEGVRVSTARTGGT